MSDRIEQLRNDLAARLDAAKARVGEARESLDKAGTETQEAISAKLNAAKRCLRGGTARF